MKRTKHGLLAAALAALLLIAGCSQAQPEATSGEAEQSEQSEQTSKQEGEGLLGLLPQEDTWVLTNELHYTRSIYGQSSPPDVESIEYDYDDQGNLVARHSYHGSEPYSETSYEYEDGNLVRSVLIIYNDGEVDSVSTTEYAGFDSRGNWTSRVETIEDASTLRQAEYVREVEYDAAGNLVLDISRQLDDEYGDPIATGNEWEYDSKGNLIYTVEYHYPTTGGYTLSHEYEYDDKGRVSFDTVTLVDERDGETFEYHEHTYDQYDGYYIDYDGMDESVYTDDGQLLYKEDYYYNRVFGYAYDDAGNAIEKVCWLLGGLEYVERIDYDDHGNVLTSARRTFSSETSATGIENVSYVYTNLRTGELMHGEDASIAIPPEYPEHVVTMEEFLWGDTTDESVIARGIGDDDLEYEPTAGEIIGHWEAQGEDLAGWTFDIYDDGTFYADVPSPGTGFWGQWDNWDPNHVTLAADNQETALEMLGDHSGDETYVRVIYPSEAYNQRSNFVRTGAAIEREHEHEHVSSGSGSVADVTCPWDNQGTIMVTDGELTGFTYSFEGDSLSGSFVARINDRYAYGGNYTADDGLTATLVSGDEGGTTLRITPDGQGGFVIDALWPPPIEGTTSYAIWAVG